MHEVYLVWAHPEEGGELGRVRLDPAPGKFSYRVVTSREVTIPMGCILDIQRKRQDAE